MLLYYSQTVSAIAIATCDLRAVALLLFEAITTEPYPYLPKRMCECAIPKVLRASRRSGVLIIPKSARLLNLEGWLIDATGYAPGLPSPKRPISVLAQNLWGIPSVLI